MSELLERPPRTIMEVYKMLPEGTLAELVDGIIYMSPAPFDNHQTVSMNLSIEMGSFIRERKLGKLFAAPFDVYLDEQSNAVQPDITVVLKENKSIIRGHIHGVPDMIIEILSRGSREYDSGKKKNLYERCGVKEYWIINPVSMESVGFVLEEGKYKEIARLTNKIDSRLLQQEFRFDQRFE